MKQEGDWHIPMQFLGPALNGIKENGCLSLVFSLAKNRSGLNASGSG